MMIEMPMNSFPKQLVCKGPLYLFLRALLPQPRRSWGVRGPEHPSRTFGKTEGKPLRVLICFANSVRGFAPEWALRSSFCVSPLNMKAPLKL